MSAKLTLHEMVSSLWSILTTKETVVFALRHGIIGGRELSYKDIGCALNVTPSRARQLHAKAAKKLTHATFLRESKDAS